jgi:hypothetical protein
MYSVASSNISSVGFANGKLFVEFKSGKTYSYDATESEVNTLKKAESIGSHFSRHFRGREATLIEDEE